MSLLSLHTRHHPYGWGGAQLLPKGGIELSQRRDDFRVAGTGGQHSAIVLDRLGNRSRGFIRFGQMKVRDDGSGIEFQFTEILGNRSVKSSFVEGDDA